VSCHPDRVGRRSRPDTSTFLYHSDNADSDQDNDCVASSASDEGVDEEELKDDDSDIIVVQICSRRKLDVLRKGNVGDLKRTNQRQQQWKISGGGIIPHQLGCFLILSKRSLQTSPL